MPLVFLQGTSHEEHQATDLGPKMHEETPRARESGEHVVGQLWDLSKCMSGNKMDVSWKGACACIDPKTSDADLWNLGRVAVVHGQRGVRGSGACQAYEEG